MIAALLRILALVRKELLAMLKDPKSRNSLIIPPVLQCLIFGYAATYDLNNVAYVVLDHDHTLASRGLMAAMDGSGIFRRIATLRRESEIADYINDTRALVAVVIPRDFERGLYGGTSPVVQVIVDGRNSNTGGIAQGDIDSIIADYGATWRAAHAMPAAGVQVSARAWYNPNLETRWNMIPSMIGLITMTMTMVLTAQSVAREREEGTFDQLLVAPFRPTEIMIGKAVPAMLMGVMQSTLVLLVAQLWFRIPFAGSYAVLYLGLLFFLAASVGIGLFISALAANMQQAMIGTFVVMMPFNLLSGLTAPIGNMPVVLQYFTMINPLRYAISITHQIYLEGAGIRQLAPELLALVAIAVVTLPISAWMFRNRLT